MEKIKRAAVQPQGNQRAFFIGYWFWVFLPSMSAWFSSGVKSRGKQGGLKSGISLSLRMGYGGLVKRTPNFGPNFFRNARNNEALLGSFFISAIHSSAGLKVVLHLPQT
ncbi:hypothetical protein KKD84_02850 [Patescibacteria group bacterium]|nr:hypothetical protein [Patescibacteria group bacterium]